jgi:uncharacterized protein
MAASAGSGSAQSSSSAYQDQAEARQASVPAQQGPVEAEARQRTAEERPAAAAAPTGFFAGDPLTLGLPAFIVGSVALGMVLVGFVSPLGVGASLPIVLMATGLGLLVATFWAAGVGQSMVATVLGIFAGFWLSYAFLILGLTNGWFGIGIGDAKATQELFLTAWIVIMSMLTLASLRLPLAFTAIIGLVDVALILVLIGVIQVENNLLKAGGATAFLFAAIGIYVWLTTVSKATGGREMPLGQPCLK